MKELKEYLQRYQPFHVFGFSHLVVLILLLLVSFSLPVISKKLFSPELRRLTGILIGSFVTLNFIGWYVILLLSGTFDVNQHLPLQLCHMGNLFIIPVMMNRNKKWFQVLYFWIMAGTLQAVITPDIQADFPHYWFFRYWIVHGGPVICIMYACIVYDLRPTWTGLIRSFAALNLLAIVIGLINVVVVSNYLYLCRKPPVASLIDHLGQWPWYLLGLELIGFFLFMVVYMPFFLKFRFDQRKRKQSPLSI